MLSQLYIELSQFIENLSQSIVVTRIDNVVALKKNVSCYIDLVTLTGVEPHPKILEWVPPHLENPKQIPITPMGVLAPGSAQKRPSACFGVL